MNTEMTNKKAGKILRMFSAEKYKFFKVVLYNKKLRCKNFKNKFKTN